MDPRETWTSCTVVDMGAARHCAQLVEQLYKGREIPLRLRRHIEALNTGSAGGTEPEAPQGESSHDLIGTATAAELLSCSTSYVRRIAPDLDGVQVDGGPWVFSRAAVRAYALAKDEGKRRDRD